jgi:Ca-activated chloride channel homolog
LRRRALEVLVPYLLLAVVGGLVGLAAFALLDRALGHETLEWQNRWALLLLSGCALCAWVAFHLRSRRSAAFRYSRVHDLAPARPGLVARLASLPAVLRISALALVAIALARPQTFKEEVRKVEGVDIMIVFDLSRSMEERDMRPDRVGAGKCTIHNFVARREGDRIGLVVFGREAMLVCPLTLDYRTLDHITAGLAIGDVPEMGTAIGDALGLALASLRRSDARSRVVILVSDGDSNVAEHLHPQEAKELAAEMGVRVFTVLIGSDGGGGPRLFGRRQHSVNPQLLQEIARDTGGTFFRAGDDEELAASFEEIRETLEKTAHVVVGRSPDRDLFPLLLAPAMILLLLEIGLGLTRWRRFP